MPALPTYFRRSVFPGALMAGWLVLLSSTVPAAERSHWFPRSWQTEEGLPNNTVFGIAQTADGFLWLGTPIGLARFDGVRFQGFSSTNFVAPPNRGILSLIHLRDGGLALAMDRGALVLLRSNTSSVFLPDRDLPDSVPYSLAEDAQHAVWVSYRDGSLCRVQPGKVTRFTAEDGLPEGTANCALASDQRGRVWFAKDTSFGMVRNGRLEVTASIPSPLVRLAPALDGGIWICSGTRLLKAHPDNVMMDLGEFSSVRPPSEPKAVLEDQQGGVWIGTAYSGLYHFDKSGFEKIPISHEEVTTLAEDREGSLWVGTTGDGMYQVRPRIVELERTEEGLPFEAVQSVCEDAEGTLWAATQNGALARRIAGRWQIFSPTPDWDAPATSVSADSSGAIWIGTRLLGLFCWKDGRLVSWGNTNDLVGKTVHTLQVSRSGDVWIGEDTPNALQRVRNGKVTTLQVPTDDLRVIRAMSEGNDGTIWVGTSRGVLLRVNGDQVADATVRTGRGPPPSIRCLYTSPDGTLWIGYAPGSGLGRLKNGRLSNIRMEQGLFDDGISHVVADNHGWLWFGSDRGIFKVRQEELDKVAEGQGVRVRSIHYGKGEGLPSLQANFGGAPGAFRSRDGRIWIPMRTGLAIVNPDRLRDQPPPPPVVLRRVGVDDRTAAVYPGVGPGPANGIYDLGSRSLGSPLRLGPNHRRVQFEFTALSFVAPENVHFRYRLQNFDDEWIDVEGGTERVATYSTLEAGRYRFEVTACNSDGIWNEQGAGLELVVAPFFWESWWFRTAALTGFTFIIIAIVRYVSFRRLRLQLRRLEQQEALHKERARIAKDIHDDVGANLTQIALLGDLARQDAPGPEQSSSRLATISRTARQAIKSLDEIVWAVNPRNDTLAHLIDYTGQFAVDYLRVAGIRCRLDLPEPAPEREISTDVRHNLFLVVKEALNNVVKHANATEVWLRIRVDETGLNQSIEDDGCGFAEPPGDAGADGLRNMHQRSADIGGKCRIESRPGGGTVVVVNLPWAAVQN